ncbi:MAG: TIGR00725 family protein [Candidatus Binataceae bacterium]|jgi:uncharacterized protein (TIGR00725 family)
MAAGPFIAVIGAGDAAAEVRALAFAVGREIAARDAVLVCGGLGGVMEAAAQGAREAGGHTIGILPGYNRQSANRYIEFAVATGMGEARNAIVIGSADAVVALAGEGGTMAEIGFALKLKRPVVALGAWNEITGLHRVGTPVAAVTLALELAGKRA